MREYANKAYAKINLGLDVTGLRADGYHMVRMVMQQVDLYDWIKVKPSKKEIKLDCNVPYVPTDDRNICVKAAKLMKERFPDIISGVDIYIHKFIPVAAGMAGGSTDAAEVLRGINLIFDLGLSIRELCEIGLKLGADVPYCIRGGTCLAEGIGEKLKGITPMPDCTILVVKPGFGLSTKEIYQNLDSLESYHHPDIEGLMTAMQNGDLVQTAGVMENVLELVSIPMKPIIGEIKEYMIELGALGAMMTGSGPTVFGIFDDPDKAQEARNRMLALGITRQIYCCKPLI